MTAVFGTPIAAVLLAVELLLFEWRPRSLIPVMIACAVAGFARPWLMGAGPLFPMQTAAVGWEAFGICIAAGLLSGMLSALYKMEDWFGKLPVHWMWWPAIGAVAVGVGGYFQPRALGVGYDVIADLLHGHIAVSVALSLLCVKAVMWVVALASGTSGGVLAPLLMLGAGLGVAISSVVPGTDPTLWPLVCMAAVLSGVLGAPLTSAIFALGLTGDFNALLPLLLATGVSYGFTVLVMRRSIMTEKIARRGLHIYREYSVDPQERAFVGEVMTTEVKVLSASAKLGEVSSLYFGPEQSHRGFPVLDEAGVLAGMLDRETLTQGLRTHGDMAALATLFENRRTSIALSAETCQAVGRRMAVEHLERLPVVADAHSLRLVGIVSRSDLLKPSRQVFHEEHVRERLFTSS